MKALPLAPAVLAALFSSAAVAAPYKSTGAAKSSSGARPTVIQCWEDRNGAKKCGHARPPEEAASKPSYYGADGRPMYRPTVKSPGEPNS